MVKVSVIMPCYNSSHFLREAIFSVVNQTYQSWELLICDDTSQDNSPEIIREFSEKYNNIYFVTNEFQKGAPGARNSCLKQARGKYIAFLDSDDLWLPTKLEDQINFMEKNRIDFCYTYNDVIDEKGNYLTTYKAPSKVNAHRLKLMNYMSCLTVIYDTSRIGKVEQPNLKRRNDFALWLTILNDTSCKEGFCFPQTTAVYRQNSYGLSSNRLKALRNYLECQQKFNRMNIISSYLWTSMYIIISLIKRYLPALYKHMVIKF